MNPKKRRKVYVIYVKTLFKTLIFGIIFIRSVIAI